LGEKEREKRIKGHWSGGVWPICHSPEEAQLALQNHCTQRAASSAKEGH